MTFSSSQVEEFCKVVTIKHLQFPTEDALIVWEWQWLNLEPPVSRSLTSSPQEENDLDQQADTNDITNFQHTVRIGCTKEHKYQEALSSAAALIEEGIRIEEGQH